MRILDVYPKDVYIKTEMSLQQMKWLLDFLDNCKIDYNSQENPTLAAAVSYVSNDFFKTLQSTIEHIENNGGR